MNETLDRLCSKVQFFSGAWLKVIAILLGYASMYTEPWALLGFGLTLTYNGERGKQNKMLNYWFYPAHLLILGILRFYLGI